MIYSHEYNIPVLSSVETSIPLFYIHSSKEVGVQAKLYVLRIPLVIIGLTLLLQPGRAPSVMLPILSTYAHCQATWRKSM